MVTTVDDEQQAPPPPTRPRSPRGGVEIEASVTDARQEGAGWEQAGEVVIPGAVTPPPASSRKSRQSTGGRSPRHRSLRPRTNGVQRARTTPATNTAEDDQSQASPAIAATGMGTQPRSVTSRRDNAAVSEIDEQATVSDVATSPRLGDDEDRSPQADQSPDSKTPAEVPVEEEASLPESAITESEASPAFVGQDDLVPENAQSQSSVGQPEDQPETEVNENDDQPQSADTKESPKEREKNDGGALSGVEDSFDPYAAAQPKNQAASNAGTAAVAGAVGGALVGGPAGAAAGAEAGAAVGGEAAAAGAATGAAKTSSTVAAGEEAQIARQNRADTVGLQKEQQQKTEALNMDPKKIQALQKQLNEFAAKEAGELAKKTYKQMWQFAQEGAEDWALSLTDFFLISGPVTVALYVLRWMLGNMMGDLFTKEVSLPGSTMIPGAGAAKVEINVFPPYELADMQDFERHFKAILIGGITLIIYGFIIMLLYYYTHWAEAIIAAVKAGWTAIITSIPAFQP